MTKPPKLQDWFDLAARIRQTAQALDRLKTGALAATFGGGLVIGLVAGGMWWIPAAMSGMLLTYRGAQLYLDYRRKEAQRRLEEWDGIFERMTQLSAARLTERQTLVLQSALERELVPTGRQLLLPAQSGTSAELKSESTGVATTAD